MESYNLDIVTIIQKKNLIFLRKKNRYTQAEIAKRINVKRNTYSSWENGINGIPNDKAILLAQAFGVSPQDFFFEDLEKKELTMEVLKDTVEDSENTEEMSKEAIMKELLLMQKKVIELQGQQLERKDSPLNRK